jgi:hypothetical protein
LHNHEKSQLNFAIAIIMQEPDLPFTRGCCHLKDSVAPTYVNYPATFTLSVVLRLKHFAKKLGNPKDNRSAIRQRLLRQLSSKLPCSGVPGRGLHS